MTKVLITGAAGFIGSNLTRRCLESDWEVFGVDDMSNGHEEFLDQQFVDSDNFLACDFSAPHVLHSLGSGQFDAVVHLAAVPRVSYSVEFPLETHETNVTKTLRLMQACRGNVKRFVFASSSSVYGGADFMPTPPSHPKDPKSPYALQKSIIEDYMKVYYNLYGLDSVALRFFNVFGPHQLGNSPYSTAVSAWLTAIKKGVSMRSDGDGSQTRDMCYVDNVVDACMRAVQHEGKLKAEPLNVACGDRTSNAEVLEKLQSRYPYAQYHTAPWRAGDVMHTQADITRTSELLGYVPLVRFWDGLDRTIEWYERSWDKIKDM
jgi:nucleoside-diphosphate-sugar epimerase